MSASSSSDSEGEYADAFPPTIMPYNPRSRGNMLGRGRACTRCKKRKQRCDGEHPSCASCIGAEAQCEYITVIQPRRKPQFTAGEALTAKLARLQKEYETLLCQSTSGSSTCGRSSSSTGSNSRTVSASSDFSRSSNSPGPSPDSSAGSPGFFGYTPHDPLITAIQVADMPPEDRNKVIRIFFTGSQRLGCAFLPHRFFERLAHPDKDQQPHPALTTAMLLVGSAFCEWTPGYSTAAKHDLPASCPPSHVLLAKTQAYLTDALAQVDRMLDWLQASILLSYWFFQRGRLAEGQVISAANSRMAINCNLHKIDQTALAEMLPGHNPPEGHSVWDHTLLRRPKDTYELGVRVWTWWQCWYYDAVFSLISGTPLTRHTAVPTTVFPRPSACYESGLALTLQNTSFKELYENNPPQFSYDPNEPEGASHALATYLKGLAIMEKTNQLLGRVNAGLSLNDDEFTTDTLYKLHSSLQCLLVQQLPVHKEDMLSDAPLQKQAAIKIYCSLAERIVGHVFINTSTIQLCRLSRAISAKSEDESQRATAEQSIRGLELDAARRAVGALRIFSEEVRKLDSRMRGYAPEMTTTIIQEVQEHPCLLLGFLLTSVCMVLVDHIHSLKLASPSSHTMDDLARTEEDLRLAVATIEHTAGSFPLLRTQSAKIKEYKERSRISLPDGCPHPRWEYERRAGIAFAL